MVQPISERVLGRVALVDVVDPMTKEVIVPAGQEITEIFAARIEQAGIDKVLVRSPLTCKAQRGICVKCYGRDLARGTLVSIGEPVGIIAAQSIGEPGTQLTMRTFHLGGMASKAVEQSVFTSRFDGTVKFFHLNYVQNRQGLYVVLNRNGELVIFDETGRARSNSRALWGHCACERRPVREERGFDC